MDHELRFAQTDDPLRSDSPDVWFQLITAVGPPSILVVINSWMGPRLREYASAEDVWQDTLLHAWRDRTRTQWRGLRRFRHWLLGIARHRIAHMAEERSAMKRGGNVTVTAVSDLESDEGQIRYAGPFRTTTPSQAARDKETAEALQAVLESLPDHLGEVVRLRLFEDLKIEEVAERVGLGVSGTRHRLRRGIALYRRSLNAVVGFDTSLGDGE